MAQGARRQTKTRNSQINAARSMKRIYRSIIQVLYPGEYEWRHLSPAQEQQQRQRGRDLAKLKPWERSRIGEIKSRFPRR